MKQTITAGGTHFGVVTTKVVRACPGEDLQRWPKVRECLSEYCGYELMDDEVILFNIDGALFSPFLRQRPCSQTAAWW